MVLLQLDKKARADQKTETEIVEEIENLWNLSEIKINNDDTLSKKLNSVIKHLKRVDNNNKKERYVDMNARMRKFYK